MRFRTVICVVLASLLVHCGDSPTEPMVERNLPSFATTTTEDGLSISTDKDDYQPGDVVHFTGYGWQPFDVLDIVLTDDPQTHEPHTWAVSVGADGMFHDSTYVVDEGDLNVSFTLVATSRLTGRNLTVRFTDSNPSAPTVTTGQNPNPVPSGTQATYTITISFGGNDKVCTLDLSGVTISGAPTGTWPAEPAGGFFSFSPSSVSGATGQRTSILTVTTPTGMAPGTYRFRVNAAFATNSDNNCNGADPQVSPNINLVVGPPADQTRPTVTINQAAGQADPTNASPINFTVVFSEPVTDFTAADVTLGGAGAAGATATLSGTGPTYNVAVSGMTTTGPVSASIAANVARDAAGNLNEASTSTDNTVLYDKDGPQVTINQKSSQPDPTNQSPILFTVIFDKPVNDFVGTDVTLGGTANPSSAVVSGGSDGMNFEVAVSGMTGDGTVTATIAANVAHDLAGNGNLAASSTDNEVTYDATSPTVTINQAAGQADPTNTSPINFTVVFSEPVSGFQNNDIVLSGSAHPMTAVVSTTDPDLKVYNVAVSGMTANGTVIASVRVNAADDEATNHSAASTSTDNTVTYDTTPPDVTINQKVGQADPTSALPINFTVVFTEIVTDFATGDVTLSGTAGLGSATATVTGGGTTYNVAVNGVTSSGTVIASIGVGKAHDAAGNANTVSTSTDNTVNYDPEPPVVSNVAATPNPTNGTINITATATVDDAATGNSRIVSAFYSIDGGAAIAMAASDGSFNSATENVTATIPAATIAALSNGQHTICVRGSDAAGNTSLFSTTGACVTITVDKEPPVVSNVAVTPSPTNGTINVTATAKVDDASTGNSKIVSAFYRIDGGAAIAMAASDGSFNSGTENVTATIPAATVAALSNGDHQVCVKGTDEAGNTSSFSDAGACVTLRVDKEPPVVSNVAVNPSPTNGTINVTATAKVDDAATGNSKIVSAYYSIDGGAAIAMAASDAAFDESTENVTATIPAATVAALSNGNHQICVKGTDEAGNTSSFSDAGACATLRVDKEPPVVSNVATVPNPTNGSIDVNATATVDDASAGNSDVVSAVYSIDGGPTHPMTASDGSFDSATENVKATIPAATVAALSNGTHQVCVRGTDAAGNTSSFSDATACVTLIIDKEPPVVSNVAVSPNLTNGSINVTATAHVDDAATGSSRIVAAYYSIDGGAAIAMSASDGSFSSETENVTATIPAATVHALDEGEHTVCVKGKDLAGNMSAFTDAGACATLRIDKTPPEVTINQAGTQGDPTKASPINFTVVFTENVSDFATGDVSLSGTAGPTTAVVTGSGMTYNVAVNGMTGDGTVIASIASGKAHDAAGNGNNASTSTDNTVVYDKTPPDVACGIADGNWHPGDVSIACTASDVTSGLANAADASFNLMTNVAANNETSNALTGTRTIFDLAGNSATAGPIGGNKVDKKAPQIASMTCPANLVLLNDPSAVANWTATDGGSGVSPSGASSASGTVALVTTSIGEKTASITKQDMVGNTSPTVDCHYTVGYNFSGFFAPVDRPNTMNVSKAGQAIPLKWRLTDALGRPITDVTSVTVQSVGMPCGTYTGQDVIEEYAAGSSGLQNLGDGNYQFNWKTPANYAGTCKSIALAFGAGGGYTEKPSAYFTFKK